MDLNLTDPAAVEVTDVDQHEHVCIDCAHRVRCETPQCFWRPLDFEGLNVEATVWAEDGSHALTDPAECPVCSPPLPVGADADEVLW